MLINDMPDSLPLKTLSNVIDGAIPIAKKSAIEDTETGKSDPGTEESQTRRVHRQRMKAFLTASKSVA